MSTEREQPSTAFRSTPHLVTFFKPQPFDELTSKFDAVSGDEDFSDDISGIAWGDPDRPQLEGHAFLRDQHSAVRGDGDNEEWNCTCVPDSLFTESFEPAAGMNSFGGSLNPVPEDGGNGYDCTSAGADHYLKPTLNWDAICDIGTS